MRNKIRRTWPALIALFFLPSLFSCSGVAVGQPGAAVSRPGAAVSWPGHWKVFLPVDHEAPYLPREELARIPERIEAGGQAVEGRWVAAETIEEYRGVGVSLENTFLDLEPFFGEVAAGNTAYVFLPVEASRAGRFEIGLGADWWMQGWLNGEKIIDTGETGNISWPAMIDNHRLEVDLNEGVNVLAIRFVSGSGSSWLAAGGPGQLAALDRIKAEHFPVPGADQAYWSARAGIDLSRPEAGLVAGEIAGVEAMPSRQLFYTGLHRERHHIVRDRENPDFDEPVRLLLSRRQYPAEDGHLDAVVWLTPEEAGSSPTGHLEITLRDKASGVRLARGVIDSLYPSGIFFSLGLPASLGGHPGVLEVAWLDGQGQELGRAEGWFEVLGASGVARSGEVGLRIPNDTGAVIERAPVTIGVPFPRGALYDERRVRLVDEAGIEVPLQARVSARWSRYGPVRWLLCDFSADLDGRERRFTLQYGPQVSRRERPAISVDASAPGVPLIEAGRLRVTPEGFFYDTDGSGRHRKFLEGRAFLGAYVEHEDGRRFTVAPGVKHEIEESGSEKVVVRRTGWYRETGGEQFCNYVTRLVFHRDSPVIRIYHTWIFTGDGNRDRVSEMGWEFPLAPGVGDGRFLDSFGPGGAWTAADYLLQWDHDGFDLFDGGEVRAGAGRRAPGVAGASGGGVNFYFGAKDFWQNFPSELEFADGSLFFHNWPRHNRAPSYERPVAPWQAYRLRFAHEGEALDFRLPEEYASEDIWSAMSGRGYEAHYAKDRPETANAQGVARTEEMFLYLGGRGVGAGDAARVMEGLNDETLRAVVDPAWVAASGAFGRIHHRDHERYGEDERIYGLVSHAPARWAERLGAYGMWIFGDVPAWGMNLYEPGADPYRAFRANHHGWPFRWVPYARSGDRRLLVYAERATRRMADTAFCHYADEAVEEAVGPDFMRRQGWWNEGLVPWASRYNVSGPSLRSYTVETDYLWHSYYITGARRGVDVALLWGDLVRRDDLWVYDPGRASQSNLSSYLEMYRATFDPWFLVAAHSIAEMYRAAGRTLGGFWRPAERDYLDFSGCPDFRERYLADIHPERQFIAHELSTGGLWPAAGWPSLEPHASAWHLTGDDYYLRRLSHELDRAGMEVYEGEPDYFLGFNTGATPVGVYQGAFTGWYLHHFPYALGAFEAAGRRPGPVPRIHFQGFESEDRATMEDGRRVNLVRWPQVFLRKEAGGALDIFTSARHVRGDDEDLYRYSVQAPGGETVLSGSFPRARRLETRLPAELPGGVYRLSLEAEVATGIGRMVYLPVAHRDTPEVYVFRSTPEGTRVSGGFPVSQYWFRVPENLEEFWVEFPVSRGSVKRVSIWNPDMERAWDHNYFGPEYDGPDPVRAVVRVRPEYAGRLWRVSIPAHGGFLIDGRIPPIFSVSRDKWFDPALGNEKTGPRARGDR